MWKQKNLFGKTLELPTEKDLPKICCESCYNALEEKCTCKCGGAYHGLGRLNKRAHDPEKRDVEAES